MKSGTSKGKSQLPSIIDMFAKQLAKRKRAKEDPINGQLSEALQNIETKHATVQQIEQNKENHNPEIDGDHENKHIEKKVKLEDNIGLPKAQIKQTNSFISKCEYCKEKLNEVKLYLGHPNGAMDEDIALTDPKLCLFSGDESFIHESDQHPQNKLTCFSVYDKNGHLCAFDTGLIEKNVLLYFSGYMKPIYEEDASPEGGVAAKDMGPINEWYVSGFDGGELALIGFNTSFAEYILMGPSEEYAPFMDVVKEKIYMSKLVIEFLLGEISPSYEDLLNKLQVI